VGDVVVLVKIPRKLKELADRYGLELDSIVREALEKEVKKRILEEARRKAVELSENLESIPDEEIAKLIRDDRESR